MGIDLSERDVNLCFSWSRMCVVEVHHNKGKVRDRTRLTSHKHAPHTHTLMTSQVASHSVWLRHTRSIQRHRLRLALCVLQVRESNLNFEGFLEALCRVSVLKGE